MSKINVEDIEKIENTNVEWFSLKNDGDTARVQFVMDNYSDIQAYMVHKVKPDGYRYDINVDCLRGYNEPLSKCPLCEAGLKVSTAKYVGIYDKADKKVKVWERGTKFIKQMKPMCDRYSPLRNYVFDIQRNGAAGSKDTTYSMFPIPNEKADDIKDLTYDAMGIGIKQWSAYEMKEYIATGCAPGSDDSNSNSAWGKERVRDIPSNVDNAITEEDELPFF